MERMHNLINEHLPSQMHWYPNQISYQRSVKRKQSFFYTIILNSVPASYKSTHLLLTRISRPSVYRWITKYPRMPGYIPIWLKDTIQKSTDKPYADSRHIMLQIAVFEPLEDISRRNFVRWTLRKTHRMTNLHFKSNVSVWTMWKVYFGHTLINTSPSVKNFVVWFQARNARKPAIVSRCSIFHRPSTDGSKWVPGICGISRGAVSSKTMCTTLSR